ncbi:MAG TPA: glycosyltransferase 87 family protein [Pyrinomonadaceae bacterium]|nr:glycosyltransferase 87 family protein [Pyrinomonadaceae bacterium]
MKSLSKNWRRAILACALFATAVKIFLALYSSGTLDVFAFREFLTNIREAGGIGTYYRTGRAGNPFNHPPFMIHAIRSMGWLTDATHLPFRFWLRFPSILADLGNLSLVWKICERNPALQLTPRALLLLAVYPGSIWISGYHGNTDPLMIFFVLLSLYLLGARGEKTWLAGAAFGMALNIKIVPIVFAPAIFLFLPDLSTRIRYFAAAAAVFLLASLPYIAQDPFVIWKTVFGYTSQYGRWGWTQLFVKAFPGAPLPLNANHELTGLHAQVAAAGRYLMLTSIIAASVWMNWRARERPPVFLQCGFVAFLFLFLTPGFGTQYLAWLVPWMFVGGAWGTRLYYWASACYITLFYLALSRPARSALNLSQLFGGNFYFFAGIVCWLALLAALVSCARLLRNYTDAAEHLTETTRAQASS